MFGLMALFGLVIMVGLMLLGASPIAMMYSGTGSMGLGAWGAMILPLFGLLGMFVMMFFMFRWMRTGGQTPGTIGHMAAMAGMKGDGHHAASENKEETMTTLTYSIPSVSCDHCKMTIERELGDLTGVASVGVDVVSKQAVIKYDSPATKVEIEALLAKIGYPPASQ